MKTKKGISEMVAYVLLIVIAVVLSTMVYSFLKIYVPKNKPECPDGISIAITDVNCNPSTISLTIQNTGRFNISAVYVRLGNANSKFRSWINDPDITNRFQDFRFIREISPDSTFDFNALPRKDLVNNRFDYTGNGNFKLEVQPAIYTGQKTADDIVLCNAIEQTITCVA